MNEKLNIIQLLENFLYWAREYDLACKKYRFLKRSKQETCSIKTAEDAFLRMEFALKEIKELREELSDCFIEKPFVELVNMLTEESSKEFSDRYQELYMQMHYLNAEIKLPGLQKFPEIIEMHDNVLQQFEVLNSNICFYNNQVEVLNFGFQIISPEEAAQQCQKMLKMVEKEKPNWYGKKFIFF